MAGKKGAGRDDRTNVRGERFDAHISANRRRADIKDLVNETVFTMLDLADIEELAVIAGDAQAGVPWAETPTARFQPSGHLGRDGVDILDMKNWKRWGGLDQTALEEIQLLAIELVDMMTSIVPVRGGWKKWFPDYNVPEEIQALVESGVLKDTTWQHDAAPNFDAVLVTGEILTVWVEHPDADRRISMDRRYSISIAPPGSRAGETVLETDRLETLMKQLRNLFKDLGGPRLL